MRFNTSSVRCLTFLFGIAFFLTSSLAVAEGEFYIEDRTLLAGSQDQEILVKANSDMRLFGFSVGLLFDAEILQVKEVTWEGALAAEPDFFHGMFDNSTGAIGFGCVFDYGPDFDNVILPGNGIALAKIVVDVAPGIDTVTELSFGDAPLSPDRSVRNVMTDDAGFSQLPALRKGTLTIFTPSGTFLRGNANSDGAVDLSDPIRILDYLFADGDAAECFDAMDGNDDGKVDLSDPIYILGFLFGGGPAMPEPYPEVGNDPTADDLPACGES